MEVTHTALQFLFENCTSYLDFSYSLGQDKKLSLLRFRDDQLFYCETCPTTIYRLGCMWDSIILTNFKTKE